MRKDNDGKPSRDDARQEKAKMLSEDQGRVRSIPNNVRTPHFPRFPEVLDLQNAISVGDRETAEEKLLRTSSSSVNRWS